MNLHGAQQAAEEQPEKSAAAEKQPERRQAVSTVTAEKRPARAAFLRSWLCLPKKQPSVLKWHAPCVTLNERKLKHIYHTRRVCYETIQRSQHLADCRIDDVDIGSRTILFC